MKKVFTILATAVAMLAFNACERSEIDGIVDNSKTSFVFTSEKPALLNEDGTKTGWNGSSVQWLKGDKIRMAFKVDDVWQSSGKTYDDGTTDQSIRIYASEALSEDAQIANFTVPTDFQGSYTGNKFEFFGLYPTKAVSGTAANNAPVLTVTIPAEQTPKADTFDSTADLMVGSAEVLTGMPTEEIPMMWNRVVALADITLKGLAITEGETPKTVTFTAQEGADLVGSHSLDLTEGTVSNPKGVNNVITINASALEIVDGNLEVWLGMLPATVTSLSVVVETDKATYTRDITGINLAFKQNKRNLLGIDMSKAVREEKEESPILTVTVAEFNAAAVSETQKYQLTGTVNGPINETFGNFDLTDETGTVYVYGLTATELGYGATNDKSYATLEIEEGDTVTLIGYRGEHNGKVEVVYAYFVSKETLTTPLIIVDKKEFDVAAAGGEYAIKPTVRNIDGDIMAKTDADWIDISYYGSDEVDFEVAANTGDARTATIVLSYEGAEDVVVTVNQSANIETIPFEKTLIGDEAGFQVEHISGTIPSPIWTNTTQYGWVANAYISGTRYVTEDDLISPVFDATSVTSLKLSFEHSGRYFNDMQTEATLWAREKDGEWAQVAIPNYPPNSDNNYVASGDIDLSAYAGKKMQFKFKYIGYSTTAVGRWNIKNLKLTEGGSEQPGTESTFTWNLAQAPTTSSADQLTWTGTPGTMQVDKANASTSANNYIPPTRTSTRFYNGSTLTITPATNVTIKSVTFEATSNNYATALANSTWSNASATASGTTVTVTPTTGTRAISAAIGATCGFTGVTVTYN